MNQAKKILENLRYLTIFVHALHVHYVRIQMDSVHFYFILIRFRVFVCCGK